MGVRTKALGWLIKEAVKAHSPEIREEVDRVKGIRSFTEAKEYGQEKTQQVREVWDEHGDDIKAAARREWKRLRDAVQNTDLAGKRGDK